VYNKNIVKNDPADDKFIHCTNAGNARAIISGDYHMLHLKTYYNIPIQTPADFLPITISRVGEFLL